MKSVYVTIIALLVLIPFSSKSQSIEIAWEKTLETRNLDGFTDVIENQNGGYTVIGATIPDGKKDVDFWLVEFNQDGSIISSKTTGTVYNDYPLSVAQIATGEYIIAGKSKSEDNKSSALIIKTDALGNGIWQKTIEDVGQLSIKNVITFDDQSIIICGTKISESGITNIWVSKLNDSGEIIWEKTFGDSKIAFAEAMKKLPDNGFVVAGKISDNNTPDSDLWLLRFDSTGEKMWDKRINSPGINVWPECVCCSPDNNLVVAGWHGTCMNDINSAEPIFDYDLFLSKISPEGKVIWTKNIDSEGSEGGNAIVVRPDGKIVVAGLKKSSYAGRVGSWIVITDESGSMLGESVFPFHFGNDKAAEIINCSDGGLIVIGPGEVGAEVKNSDGWIKKIKAF